MSFDFFIEWLYPLSLNPNYALELRNEVQNHCKH